ncbi:MAG: hypothetical protein V1847_00900 [Candidatus Diapherotrites archaeon]
MKQLFGVLARIARDRPPKKIAWAITGSAGLFLEKIRLQKIPKDVDIVTTFEGQRYFVEKWRKFQQGFISNEYKNGIHSKHARFVLEGVEVKVIGEYKTGKNACLPAILAGKVDRRNRFGLPCLSPEEMQKMYSRLGRNKPELDRFLRERSVPPHEKLGTTSKS